MLEGNLVEKNETLMIDLGVSMFELPTRMKEKIMETKASKVILGFRPEHITLTKKYQDNAIEAKVDMLELIGREIHVHLTTRECPLVAITTSTEDVKVGENVWMILDEEKIHIFDGNTGEALI